MQNITDNVVILKITANVTAIFSFSNIRDALKQYMRVLSVEELSDNINLSANEVESVLDIGQP